MSILFYHAVEDGWDSAMAVPIEAFARHCAWLRRHRRVVGLAEAISLMNGRRRLPRGVVALTFDDGFASVHANAFPLLVRYGLPVTVFLVAGTLDGGDVELPPGRPNLTRDQVLEMQEAGVRFESHTHSHRILTSLQDPECADDLRSSRESLEGLLGRPVTMLAYPGGFHDARVRRIAREAGYTVAFGTSRGREPPGPMAIPRIGVYPRDRDVALRLKTSPWYLSVRRSAVFPAVRRFARAG
jgi:peptidoglycan/xylan/chitin deacetylase (PgdA/CDA1 family)